MPSASANISAKFIAQIEMSKQLRAEVERAGGGDEAEDRQHQRQPGGDERAEGEHEDRQRHRPGDQLRLHHRVAVGLVEVRPHAGGAGEADLRRRRRRAGERLLEVVGGAHHLVRVAAPRRPDDRGVAVARDRRPGSAGATTRATRASAASRRSTPRTVGAEGRVGERLIGGVDDDHQARSMQAAELARRAARGPRPTPSRWPPSRRRRGRARPSARRRRAPTASTTQAMKTVRAWVAVQRPRRPIGPRLVAGLIARPAVGWAGLMPRS